MKFLKKIMPIMLCAVMLFALIPCVAFADGGAAQTSTEMTLAENGTDTFDGIIYTAGGDGAKLLFMKDENVTGEGNQDYFVVVLEGSVACEIAAGKSLTTAYADGDGDYTNARKIEAEDVVVYGSLYSGESENDRIRWEAGTVIMDSVSYTYVPETENPTNLQLNFNKFTHPHCSNGKGKLTVTAPGAYTDFLNEYDFADANNLTVVFDVDMENNGKFSLIEGSIALDNDEVVYLNGVKVEGDNAIVSAASNECSVTGFATVIAEDGASLTIKDYEQDGSVVVHVESDGTVIAIAAEKVGIVLMEDGDAEFSYSKDNGIELELSAGKIGMEILKDAAFTFRTGTDEKLITATETGGFYLENGKIPETNDYINVEDTPSDSHEHTWGPFVSIDGIDHVRECLDEGCDVYELMEHAWEKGLVIKEPTHTTYGEQRYTCWFCNATKIMPVEKLWQHNYESGWTHDEDAHWHACECGEKSEKAAHTFENIVHELALMTEGDCENGAVYYKSCSVCGALSDETFVGAGAEGHKFVEYISDGNATCKEDGTKTATCSACGEKNTVTDVGSKIAHNFGAYTADGNATCESDGTKTATCSVCGAKDTVTDAGSKIAHNFGAYTADSNATCESDGTKTATCSVCGAKGTVTDEGSKLAHTYEKGICTACGAEDPEYISLTWLWIALGALAVLGGGFAVHWCVIRKKTK